MAKVLLKLHIRKEIRSTRGDLGVFREFFCNWLTPWPLGEPHVFTAISAENSIEASRKIRHVEQAARGTLVEGLTVAEDFPRKGDQILVLTASSCCYTVARPAAPIAGKKHDDL